MRISSIHCKQILTHLRSLTVLGLLMNGHSSPAAESEKFAIAIHGGAGSAPATWSVADREGRKASLTRILKYGRDELAAGSSSLNVVEGVINLLEDDPLFNAGKGSVLNAEQEAQLDASIMDGRTLACGAVGAVRRVKNPISVAKLVMTKTRHVLLVDAGADQFAREQGADLVEPSYFQLTQAQRLSHRKTHLGTVGCVALDKEGNLAAGTSTGGLTGKMVGRVGDSPIIAAGTYAANDTCGVSCTGVGEEFIRNAVAYDIAARMRYADESLKGAVDSVIENTLKQGDGGIIAVDKDGNIVLAFNTPGMSRAGADSSGRFVVELGAQGDSK